MVCPILPFINDNEENINSILDYCIDNNVHGVVCFEMGLTLRDGNREYFYEKLNQHFPGLREKYITKYGNNYNLLSPNNHKLMNIFKKRTIEHGILNNNDEIFGYLSDFPQKSVQSKLI